jgi:hypothetical protein
LWNSNQRFALPNCCYGPNLFRASINLDKLARLFAEFPETKI